MPTEGSGVYVVVALALVIQHGRKMNDVQYKLSPQVTNEDLNALFAEAWPGPHENEDFGPVLRRSLGYVCAYQEGELVGFVNVAWDGGAHAFLLDPTEDGRDRHFRVARWCDDRDGVDRAGDVYDGDHRRAEAVDDDWRISHSMSSGGIGMKVLVTYMTQTGNTRKVAEAIYGEIQTDKEILPLQKVESLQGYDLSFIGFPIVRFGPEEAVKEFLAQHTRGRKIALFITHAAPEESPSLSRWFAPAREAASGAELVGVFSCQGALAQRVKEFMLNSGDPQLAEWARHDNSQGQPDGIRLERARAFAREILGKVERPSSTDRRIFN